MKPIVTITPDSNAAEHWISIGPKRDDWMVKLFIGPDPYGPHGGNSGKAVDATEIVSCRGNTRHTEAQRGVYDALLAEVRQTGKPITVTERVDAALARLSRVASFPRASDAVKIRIMSEHIGDIPAVYREALREVYGENLVDAAIKVARVKRQKAAEAAVPEIGA